MRPLPQYCRSDITEASQTRHQFCVILNVYDSFLKQFIAIMVGSLEVNKFSLLWGEAQLCLPYDCL